jgi:hypothetical protein
MKIKYTFSVIFFCSIISFPSFASSSPGQGGMSECIALASRVALDSYSANYQLNQIPTMKVEPTTGSQSNGIDVIVFVNSKVAYTIISVPYLGPRGNLLGCIEANVASAELLL